MFSGPRLGMIWRSLVSCRRSSSVPAALRKVGERHRVSAWASGAQTEKGRERMRTLQPVPLRGIYFVL